MYCLKRGLVDYVDVVFLTANREPTEGAVCPERRLVRRPSEDVSASADHLRPEPVAAILRRDDVYVFDERSRHRSAR